MNSLASLPFAATYLGRNPSTAVSTSLFSIFRPCGRGQDRARLLRERAQTNGTVDWFGLLEGLCQRVHQAEREGNPAIDLRTVARTERDDINIEGFVFPRRHPSILFGDGGAAKRTHRIESDVSNNRPERD